MAWVAPQAEIERALAVHPTVVAGVREVAERVRNVAALRARVLAFESGDYMRGIVLVDGPDGTIYVVATAGHSWFVEVGTGIHGPRRAMILAANTTASGMFKFQVTDEDGSQRTVVTPQHRGRPARHVLRDAAMAAASLPGVTWTPNPV